MPTRSPTSSLLRSPPTPSPRRPGLWFPLPPAYLDADAFLGRQRAVRVRDGVGEGVTAFSMASDVVEESEGLPGAWAVLFLRAVVQDPAGCDSPSPIVRRSRRRLQAIQHPGHPEWHSFRGTTATAHLLACLRIAERVTAPVARLAIGLGGLTPGRAGLAPAGRRTKFHGVIAPSIPLRPALPGRTEYPILSYPPGPCYAWSRGGLWARSQAERWRG